MIIDMFNSECYNHIKLLYFIGVYYDRELAGEADK